ncbi:ferritin-like domain-containing protein [Motilibacter deserti]|uniref:Ferritin-like domain-containing protein n=1 Tax=Motilibacter deserti TaxID=2714956 RepID=A0ABX0GRS7_9ACTN|nr:ferritin-like domain-containing protein [Motilibacter deserti]
MSETDALQAALAGEHAAVWAYGVVGAQLPADRAPEALAALAAHRARRDALERTLERAAASPAAAAPAYDLPGPVTTAAQAVRLAVLVEERLAAAYADLVAAAEGEALRVTAARALQETAVRGALWRRSAVPFPGLPERS